MGGFAGLLEFQPVTSALKVLQINYSTVKLTKIW